MIQKSHWLKIVRGYSKPGVERHALNSFESLVIRQSLGVNSDLLSKRNAILLSKPSDGRQATRPPNGVSKGSFRRRAVGRTPEPGSKDTFTITPWFSARGLRRAQLHGRAVWVSEKMRRASDAKAGSLLPPDLCRPHNADAEG